MPLTELLDGVQVLAVVCNQFGDSGKGKFSDFFAAEWADVIARGTGGPNAGHTVVINGKERIFHLIPAGIAYDGQKKVNILGNGMVINLESLCKELDELEREGMTFNHLMVSTDASLILPYHIARDRAKDQSQKGGGIGTTGRGIGPCYSDKVARRGIFVGDLFDRDTLVAKIKRALELYPEQNIDAEQIVAELEPFATRIKPFVRDTVAEMHRFVREGKKICLEGAQGLLLSIEHGTCPYVTSSDCSVNGTASGVGISAGAIDLVLGIIKFPFMTRVGGGPFPTELGGRVSEEHCAAERDIFYEVKTYLGMDIDLDRIKALQKSKDEEARKALAEEKKRVKDYIASHRERVVELMNDEDSFIQGIGIRLAAGEYGATTGRPRRVGWTDAVAARYAVGINGPLKLILTKADALAGIKEFKIAHGYKTSSGRFTPEFTRDSRQLRGTTPFLAPYSGYGDIRGETNYDKLPQSLKDAISDFEQFARAPVAVVSTGADQQENVVR